MNPPDAETLALEAARILDAKLAKDIRVIDVRGRSTVTDFWVIATGTSAPHLKALVVDAEQQLKQQHGTSTYRRSGTPDSGWVVLDLVHVVIHIFAPEARAYYAIERLWPGAPELAFAASPR